MAGWFCWCFRCLFWLWLCWLLFVWLWFVHFWLWSFLVPIVFFSFWLPGVGLWFCRGCVYLVGFCFLSGVCGSIPFRPCCVVFCVWMSFYFCCCGEVGGFHSCGVFSGRSGPCLVCALCGFRGFSFLVWSFVFYGGGGGGGGVVVCLLSCRLSSCSLCLLSGVLVLCLFCGLSVVLSGVRGEISTGSLVCRYWHWSPRLHLSIL